MVNTMDNVGWNRTRGDLLHPATIVKRAGFRKCLVGAVGSMRRRCVAAVPALGVAVDEGDRQPFSCGGVESLCR